MAANQALPLLAAVMGGALATTGVLLALTGAGVLGLALSVLGGVLLVFAAAFWGTPALKA